MGPDLCGTVDMECMLLLSMQTQLLEHYIFKCHLLHVLAIFGHHQVYVTTTYMEKNAEVLASHSQLMH
jgi:hypothetical protein